jgi:hypothetical protein
MQFDIFLRVKSVAYSPFNRNRRRDIYSETPNEQIRCAQRIAPRTRSYRLVPPVVISVPVLSTVCVVV